MSYPGRTRSKVPGSRSGWRGRECLETLVVVSSMRAIAYEDFGSADVLTQVEVPRPHAGPDTLLVQVVAAGVNPVDYKARQGHLQGLIDSHFPVIPGWDLAGIVVEPGLDTPEFEAGDEIFAYARQDVIGAGTLAEYAAVPVRTAARKPQGLSFEQAAAIPLAGLTAYQTIRRAGVRPGQRVLIHAAAGGVGSFAVQLARHAGARVVGTASAANHDYLRSLGADPIEYGPDLVRDAQRLAPGGYDVILDFVGGAAIDTAGSLLADEGTVSSIVDPRARDELGGQYVWVRPDATDLHALSGLAQEGVLHVELAEVFDLAQSAEAHRAMETGHTRGKIVVRI